MRCKRSAPQVKPLGDRCCFASRLSAAASDRMLEYAGGYKCLLQNIIKDPHRYAVQVSDTTMMPKAS